MLKKSTLHIISLFFALIGFIITLFGAGLLIFTSYTI